MKHVISMSKTPRLAQEKESGAILTATGTTPQNPIEEILMVLTKGMAGKLLPITPAE